MGVNNKNQWISILTITFLFLAGFIQPIDLESLSLDAVNTGSGGSNTLYMGGLGAGNYTKIEPVKNSRALLPSHQSIGFTEISSGLPTTGYYEYIVFGDFNNDDEIDILVSGDDHISTGNEPPNDAVGMYAYTGNGGTYWTKASKGLAKYNSWAGCALADADADGHMEAYAANGAWGTSRWSGIEVWEYRNNKWTGSQKHVSSPKYFNTPFNVVLVDITGDSKIDIVFGNGSGLGYAENKGGNPVKWQLMTNGLDTNHHFTALDIADMNKDGLKDILGCDDDANEYLYIQNSNGNLWTNYWNGINITGKYYGIKAGDVNNDGHMDIVYGGHYSGLKCVLGNSGGFNSKSFSWTPANTGLPSENHYYQFQLCDIDLDGDLDIIAPRSYIGNAGIEIYLGNGSQNPGMNQGWTLATNTNLPTTGNWTGVNCHDINGDGAFDIVGVSYGFGIKAWLNNLSFDITSPRAVSDQDVTNVPGNSITIYPDMSALDDNDNPGVAPKAKNTEPDNRSRFYAIISVELVIMFLMIIFLISKKKNWIRGSVIE